MTINDDLERQRLRSVYEALLKTPHGAIYQERHPEILPEWIAGIIENPHDRWNVLWEDGEIRTILVGSARGFRQWIVVVLMEDGAFQTTYPDRRMEKRFGGRPC